MECSPLKILIVVLTTYERTGWVSKELAEFIHYTRYLSEYAVHVGFAHNFIPAASARNFFAKHYSDTEADWICMIDNDMAPPGNLLDSVKDAPADASVVVPVFHLWEADSRSTRLCWGLDNGADALRLTPGFHEIATAGTGAMFIRPEVFKKVPAPWFWYSYDEQQGMTSTEDINFCKKVRAHGLKIYGNASIEVGHHHSVNLALVNGAFNALKLQQENARPAEEPAVQEACPAR